MFRTALVVCALACLGVTGCYKMNYTGTAQPGGKVVEKKQKYFLWGLAGGDDLQLRQMCPEGVASISSEHSVVDYLLFSLTGGLYSPVSVRVECGSGTAFNVDRSEQGKLSVSSVTSGDKR